MLPEKKVSKVIYHTSLGDDLKCLLAFISNYRDIEFHMFSLTLCVRISKDRSMCKKSSTGLKLFIYGLETSIIGDSSGKMAFPDDPMKKKR